MVHLLGIYLVTVREDCQVVASSLMTPMHNVVQEEVVSYVVPVPVAVGFLWTFSPAVTLVKLALSYSSSGVRL